MAELEIVGAPMSNYVWSVRVACEEKGVPYKLAVVRPHSPEALACGPTGKIPGLRHGEVALSESKALISYIDRAFKGRKLMPAKPAAMAEVEQWCSIVNTAVDPAWRRYIACYFFPQTPDKKPDPAAIAAAVPGLEKVLGMLEARLTASRHLAAGKFSPADMLLVPMLVYLQKLPESSKLLKKHKKLNSYLKRLAKRPSVAATRPKEAN
ncbi:MAG TPA: glutathione S-transferase family protein [Beijerinckiaceae bacterium]|nr:glutathione S-transferase family protein [Beijerinckiaceae bacterium]